MRIEQATTFVLNGGSLLQLAADVRAEHLAALGIDPSAPSDPNLGRAEASAFMRSFARHLGDRHAGNPRIGRALREWVSHTDHYEAWDALLSGFQVESRDALVRRGQMMFPRSLTAHWTEP